MEAITKYGSVQVKTPATHVDEDDEDAPSEEEKEEELPETTLEESIVEYLASLPKDTAEIDLTHSRIRMLPALDFPNLLELDLRQNLLTEAQISPGSLPSSLVDLDLYDNRINVCKLL
jgi:Leucine-rich repeat (LRR) protein